MSKGAKILLRKTMLSAPVISLANTFAFEGDTVEVEISAGVPGATIYYTTDGAQPTEKSQVYEKPLKIIKTSAIKAKSVKEDFEQSCTQSNFIEFINP